MAAFASAVKRKIKILVNYLNRYTYVHEHRLSLRIFFEELKKEKENWTNSFEFL